MTTHSLLWFCIRIMKLNSWHVTGGLYCDSLSSTILHFRSKPQSVLSCSFIIFNCLLLLLLFLFWQLCPWRVLLMPFYHFTAEKEEKRKDTQRTAHFSSLLVSGENNNAMAAGVFLDHCYAKKQQNIISYLYLCCCCALLASSLLLTEL